MFTTIQNDYLRVTVTDLGATLNRFVDKRTGIDIVLGYDTEEEYLKNSGHLGACVGRNANRIKNAEFTLNGEVYHLAKNNNMNNLHGGGKGGFAFKRWTLREQTDTKLVYTYFAKDGEEGFPGNLQATVTYELFEDTMTLSFEGTTDKDTLFNRTSHAYFNLGDDNILNETLMIATDKYAPTDEYAMTLDEVLDTHGTAYDFSAPKKIGENVSKLPTGIDNNYVFEEMGDKLVAVLSNDRLELSLYSDLPDMHLYTGYGLGPYPGKDGQHYDRYQGVALECQYFPNAVNFDRYIKPILKAGETRKNYIRYVVRTK